MDTVGYIIGGLIAVIACSFQDGGNGSMYLGSAGVSSMFVGVIALFNAIVSLREKILSFFSLLATVCSFLAVGVWAALYIVGFCCK